MFYPQLALANPITVALSSSAPEITAVMRDPKGFELQIVLSTFDSELGSPRQFEYQLNEDNYFYPASTVKLPMALAAVEFISQHPKLNLSTAYSIDGSAETHSVANDVREIFSISDDQAYNRLYELIGRDGVNQRMHALGYGKTLIQHRLGVKNADVGPRRQVIFTGKSHEWSFNGEDRPPIQLHLNSVKKGVGFIKEGLLVEQPFDFTLKNYFPLEEQHRLLRNFVSGNGSNFKLSPSDRDFVLTTMSQTPAEAGFENPEYYDSYSKFFLFGDTRKAMPQHIKIFNKVGYAYGTLTDNAYIVDEQNGVRFLLSATILVNQNRVFNDDSYEYDSIGIPFLAQLGREIYAIELAKRSSR